VADKDITLNYIDKIFNNLIGTGKTMNNLIVTQFVVDLIIIALCLNPLLVAPEYSVGGLKFYLGTSFILAIGALITGILVVISIGLIDHGNFLLNNIRRLYQSLDYSDEAMRSGIINVLEHPDFASIIVAHVYGARSFAKFAVILILFILPIITQLFAAYRVIIIYNWSYWVIILFLLLLLLTISPAFGWLIRMGAIRWFGGLIPRT
jgi:hypothetical protein